MKSEVFCVVISLFQATLRLLRGMKRAQVPKMEHTPDSLNTSIFYRSCAFYFFTFTQSPAIWKCSPQEWNIRLFKCWAAELQPGGTFPGACLVKSLETDGNNGIKLFLSFFYLFSLSSIFFLFHVFISLFILSWNAHKYKPLLLMKVALFKWWKRATVGCSCAMHH